MSLARPFRARLYLTGRPLDYELVVTHLRPRAIHLRTPGSGVTRCRHYLGRHLVTPATQDQADSLRPCHECRRDLWEEDPDGS